MNGPLESCAYTNVQATGNVGRELLKALLRKPERYSVTVVTRSEGQTLPENVNIKVVDIASRTALQEAFTDQQVVFDTSRASSVDTAIPIIDAAVAAGVSRFVLSEYSMDPAETEPRKLPPFQGKDLAMQHIQKLADENKISWSSISTGAFLDWNLRVGFSNIHLKSKEVSYCDDGSAAIAWTPLKSIGEAAANLLEHLDETKNRMCYIFSTYKSQKQLAELAMEALGPEDWKIEQLDMEQVFREATERFASGKIDDQVIGDIVRWTASKQEYNGPWDQNDNDLLGVEEMSDEEIRNLIKEVAAEP
ncbi:Hypothetical protein D9617_1g084290 [Elsinoe fawcettii]|nr:Hypothetical protein D9617_1g084290 [Elsinoe fawcettii]